MATTNDITGDALVSRANSDSYRNNYDRIFGKTGNAAKHDAATLVNAEKTEAASQSSDPSATTSVK